MSSAEGFDRFTVSEYLAGEEVAKRKHEYVCGMIYAHAGGTNAHNIIASNVTILLGGQLRGRPCRALNSDTKIKISSATGTRFYYPDSSVVCQSNPATDSFQEAPVVVVEVLSAATRRIDDGEKREAYCSIPSLETYVLLEQSSIAAVVYRREQEGFNRVVVRGPDAVIPVTAIDCQLALKDVYEGVDIIPESPEEDD